MQVRRNTKVLAKNLQGDVRALRTATAVLAERVARADDDVLGYESTGKLHFRTGDLAADVLSKFSRTPKNIKMASDQMRRQAGIAHRRQPSAR